MGVQKLTEEQINLEAIRAELALHSQEQQAVVEALAQQLRDAIERVPLLAAAMALVAAEILAANPEE